MLRFGAKIPGLGLDVRSVTMDFQLRLGVQRRLAGRLRDAHPLTRCRVMPRCSRVPTRSSTRGRSWTRSSRRGPTRMRRPFRTTKAGTRGPPKADQLLAREGHKWRRIGSKRAGPSSAGPRRPLDRRHRAGVGEDLVAGRPQRPRPRRRRRPARRGPDSAGRTWSSSRAGPRSQNAALPDQPCVDRPASVPDLDGCSADPDGPAWLDGRVEAHCVLPREDAPEICAR